MPILLNDLSLVWPDGTTCFSGLNGAFSGPLTALIGDNGAGKITLLEVILGNIPATAGTVEKPESVAYLPQDLAWNETDVIADIFGVSQVLAAISKVEAGEYEPELYELIGGPTPEKWTRRGSGPIDDLPGCWRELQKRDKPAPCVLPDLD